MTILCITGGSHLPRVHAILRSAGMSDALPPGNRSDLTPELWQQHVLRQQSSLTVEGMDRMWGQLATDILLANLELPCWGWSDPNSIELMEFWADFDSSIRFLLVCETPQQLIANRMSQNVQTASLQYELERWHSLHAAMIHFSLRNPTRSILVWGNELVQAPHILIEHINQQWATQLEFDAGGTTALSPTPALEEFVAGHVAHSFLDLKELSDELIAVVPTFCNESTQADYLENAEDLLAAYRQIKDRSEIENALSILRNQYHQSLEDGKNLRLQVTAVETDYLDLSRQYEKICHEQDVRAERQSSLEAKLQIAIEKIGKAEEKIVFEKQLTQKFSLDLDSERAAYARLVKQTAEARDVVDQEVAAIRSDAVAKQVALTETLEMERAAYAESVRQASQARDALDAELAAVRVDAAAKLAALGETLEMERAAYTESLRQASQARDALDAELVAVRVDVAAKLAALGETLEMERAAYTESLRQASQVRDALEEELAATRAEATAKQAAFIDSLESERAAHLSAALRADETKGELASAMEKSNALEIQVQTLKSEQSDTARCLSALEGEAGMLLGQLHAAQELAESSFLSLAKEKELHALNYSGRWRRLQKRFPETYDFGEVTIAGREDGVTLWEIKGLEVAGRHIEILRFKTVVESGVAGFIFERQMIEDGQLIRWPFTARASDQITVIPSNNGRDFAQRAATIVQLAGSDWDLVRALPFLLIEAIRESEPGIHVALERASLVSALTRSGELMGALQGLVRFDDVRLLARHESKPREVVSVCLEQLQHGNCRIPRFEFQFQASAGEGVYGENVLLIFPENTAGAPFEAWVNNAVDAGGRPVMALPVTDAGPDSAFWDTLCNNDRDFVTALIDSLGIVMMALQASRIRLSRPWREWLGLARELRVRIRRGAALTVPGTPAECTPPDRFTPTVLPDLMKPQHKRLAAKKKRRVALRDQSSVVDGRIAARLAPTADARKKLRKKLADVKKVSTNKRLRILANAAEQTIKVLVAERKTATQRERRGSRHHSTATLPLVRRKTGRAVVAKGRGR